MITLAGLQLPTLLGGALVTETVFTWPGMGRLFLDSLELSRLSGGDGPADVLGGAGARSAISSPICCCAAADPRIRLDMSELLDARAVPHSHRSGAGRRSRRCSRQPLAAPLQPASPRVVRHCRRSCCWCWRRPSARPWSPSTTCISTSATASRRRCTGRHLSARTARARSARAAVHGGAHLARGRFRRHGDQHVLRHADRRRRRLLRAARRRGADALRRCDALLPNDLPAARAGRLHHAECGDDHADHRGDRLDGGGARSSAARSATLRERDFALAAEMLGASDVYIMFSELSRTPSDRSWSRRRSPLRAPSCSKSYISFLGYGIQPPTPSWGNMLNNAQQYLGSAPWLAIFPGSPSRSP